MTEHVHEWYFLADYKGGYEAKCACQQSLGQAEIERRLNATERLSAEYCHEIISLVEELSAVAGDNLKVSENDALRAYAAALEGE